MIRGIFEKIAVMRFKKSRNFANVNFPLREVACVFKIMLRNRLLHFPPFPTVLFSTQPASQCYAFMPFVAKANKLFLIECRLSFHHLILLYDMEDLGN